MENPEFARLVIEGPHRNSVYVGGTKSPLTLEYSTSLHGV